MWPSFDESSVQVKAGGEVRISGKIQLNKSLELPTPTNYRFFRFEGIDNWDELPLPDGLTVRLTPASFILYPNSTYQISVVLETSVSLAPGKYQLELEWLSPGNYGIPIDLTVN
jgi:hypothetical protein